MQYFSSAHRAFNVTVLVALLAALPLLAPAQPATRGATDRPARVTRPAVPISPGLVGRPQPRLTPEEQKKREQWRSTMALIPLPRKGCYTVAYPSQVWVNKPCKATPTYPQPPRHGQPPLTVGNNNDVSAQAPSGAFISTAIGSFDSVTGVTSESGPIANTGAAIANAYTLQLNTNFFASTSCAGSPNPSCQGWQQFVFENDGSSGSGYIQYWLIQYNTSCPPDVGWKEFSFTGSTDVYCWKNNSEGAVSIPAQAISNLGALSVLGTVSGGGDTLHVSTGSEIFAVSGDNAVNAAAGWQIAEFNVFGDGGSSAGGGQATFNNGASVVVRMRVLSNGLGAPACVAQGFTAETNNLNFGPGAPAASPPGPAVIFTESSAGGAASNCAAAVAVPGLHGVWNLAGNTAGFGQVDDGRPFWVGNFDGQAGDDILFYYPGDKNWWLGRFGANGVMSWKLAGNTAGFGQVGDGRPFWVGNFDGQVGSDILFYYPGDKNWWLGRFDANGALTWKLAGNTSGFGQVSDGRPFWVGNFDGQGGSDILFYYPGDKNWWLGRFDANGALTWKLAGNTSGFGQVSDGRPFWVGNFDGQGGSDILFYYPGDKNWWLGRFDAGGVLSWKLAGNTAGFGQVGDGRPIWASNFDGQGGDDIQFYSPADKYWWLGRFAPGGTLGWTLTNSTLGFGQVGDGRPFWVGDFDGQGGSDVLFYYPGDKNWWLGRVVE